MCPASMTTWSSFKRIRRAPSEWVSGDRRREVRFGKQGSPEHLGTRSSERELKSRNRGHIWRSWAVKWGIRVKPKKEGWSDYKKTKRRHGEGRSSKEQSQDSGCMQAVAQKARQRLFFLKQAGRTRGRNGKGCRQGQDKDRKISRQMCGPRARLRRSLYTLVPFWDTKPGVWHPPIPSDTLSFDFILYMTGGSKQSLNLPESKDGLCAVFLFD